jgi:hypothetical protein
MLVLYIAMSIPGPSDIITMLLGMGRGQRDLPCRAGPPTSVGPTVEDKGKGIVHMCLASRAPASIPRYHVRKRILMIRPS